MEMANAAQKGQKMRFESIANRAHFVLKIELDIQLGILWHIGSHPHSVKNTSQNGDF